VDQDQLNPYVDNEGYVVESLTTHAIQA
jgi:hypothetical protein